MTPRFSVTYKRPSGANSMFVGATRHRVEPATTEQLDPDITSTSWNPGGSGAATAGR